MKLYPLKFNPIAVERAWGGTSLAKKFGKKFTVTDEDGEQAVLPEDTPVGESLEAASLGEGGESVAENGYLAGNTLGEITETYLDELTGDNVSQYFGTQFPLTVKFLDIAGRMPLTVCPDDEVAFQRYDSLGRSECWYIMEAAEDACIYAGFSREISAEEFFSRCLAGTLREVMNRIIPSRGEMLLLRPGTVYSAEGGIIAASVGEASALGFALEGYSQEGEAVEVVGECMDFVNLGAFDAGDWIRNPQNTAVDTREFTIRRIELGGDKMHIRAEDIDSCLTYVCIKGSATVNGCSLTAASAVVVPAETEDIIIEPGKNGCLLLEASIAGREDKDDYISDKESK